MKNISLCLFLACCASTLFAQMGIKTNNTPIVTKELKEGGSVILLPLMTIQNMPIFYRTVARVEKEYAVAYPVKKKRIIVQEYFFGKEKVQKVTRTNYKKLLKRLFIDFPDLQRMVGKKDFRFTELHRMMMLYQKKKNNLLPKNRLQA